MVDTVTVVLGNYPHTAKLKANPSLGGADLAFPDITPVHDAFDAMARTQAYDVCEMAIGAFLQARDAGKPLVLLPAVMVGSFHYRSLYPSPKAAAGLRTPADLRGRRVGVRSYSQTTGLWVRGWLRDEFDLAPGDVEWAVTERSHVEEFQDPPNVHLIDQPLDDALRDGAVDAAIIGASTAPDLNPLLPDHEARARAWYAEHGCAPINHLVVTTQDLLDRNRPVLDAIYRTIAEGIDEARRAAGPPAPDALPSAIRHGLGEVRGAVELAARYAHDQGLIGKPITDVDALFALTGEDDRG